VFDFNAKLNELLLNSLAVDDMLNYSKELCSTTYENLWRTHYNVVYKFVGLLLAYVERVNLVWQKQT